MLKGQLAILTLISLLKIQAMTLEPGIVCCQEVKEQQERLGSMPSPSRSQKEHTRNMELMQKCKKKCDTLWLSAGMIAECKKACEDKQS